MIPHLNEEQIQLYAEQAELAGSEVIKHLQQCESCRVKAENYRQVFISLPGLGSPAFDFDLSGLVAQQLPAPKQKLPGVVIVASLAGLVLMVFAATFFVPGAVILVRGVSTLSLAMLVVPVLTVVSIQALSYFSDYHQKLQRLKTS